MPSNESESAKFGFIAGDLALFASRWESYPPMVNFTAANRLRKGDSGPAISALILGHGAMASSGTPASGG